MPPKATAGASASAMTPRALLNTVAEASAPAQRVVSQDGSENAAPKKKKRHRAGRKKARRQSFAAPSEASDHPGPLTERPNLDVVHEDHQQNRSSFYRLGNAAASDTSLESGILLDHRDQNHSAHRPRRLSFQQQASSQAARLTSRHTTRPHADNNSPSHATTFVDDSGDDDFGRDDDRAPLIVSHHRQSRTRESYGGVGSRRRSNASSASTRKKLPPRQPSTQSFSEDYDINNPPSVPGSPRLGASDDGFPDVLLPDMNPPDSHRKNISSRNGEAIIDVDPALNQSSPRSQEMNGGRRRQPGALSMEDVCLPFEQMTEAGDEEEEYMQREHGGHERAHKRHRKMWPDLSVLDEWAGSEKEQRTMEGVRAKKVNEPVLIGGRLRPQRGGWRRDLEEEPFRWTYFNEEFDSSLRSHTISGLQQLGHSFKELFIPEPPELEDSSSSSEDETTAPLGVRSPTPNGHGQKPSTRQSSLLDASRAGSKAGSGERTPPKAFSVENNGRSKRYGPRPVFWLDVLEPTWEEMKVLSRAFGIHKLTAEDIMEQEAREKVELFRNYYFVNYRTFEQDEKSEDYLDPVNMYFVVFKGGVLSFHFSQMPHPPNVRRRIRQLAEHQYTDSDWIAYAIIDNITDAYAPLIELIEQQVDDIDDEILMLHSNHGDDKGKGKAGHEKGAAGEECGGADTSRDMLLRVGECRKRVMGLYRLLGNKADVIKGLAKRCNEQWSVAPRSDVGLYLGDIQDHIVTMTGNLTHYESILSRAHSNYLAQINIGMNERAEKTNDVLGKLTVLGTIVLPMNIVTGMWGMNCLVPGQVDDNPTLAWFFALTAFLLLFGLTSFFVAKKVYKIV